MQSYASLTGCNSRRLKAPIKGMSSYVTDLTVYARIFFVLHFLLRRTITYCIINFGLC